jgi:hypothetical protein
LICGAEPGGQLMHKGGYFLAAMILSTCTVARAMADEDPAALYLNKDYWARMVWNEAVSSALWQMDGWDPFRGKQSGYATFVGKRQVTMLGVTFDANLAYRNDRHVNQHFTSLYTAGKNPISKAQCENAISEITTRFGKPVTNDGTVAFAIAPNSFLRLVDYQYQWDIGDTRIFGGCSNFSVTQDGEVLNDDDKYTLSLKFAHVSVTPKLARKFALICNRAATHVADGTTGSLNDMGVWIDTFSSHVLDTNLVELSDKGSFRSSDAQIQFSMTRQNLVTDYTINRYTGSLSASAKEQGHIVARISGKCSKSENITRKF